MTLKVRHRVRRGFWKHFGALDPSVQLQAVKQFQLLKADLEHPSLHLKKVGKGWSVRVNQGYRAVGRKMKDRDGVAVFLWHWIGPHDQYMRVIGEL